MQNIYNISTIFILFIVHSLSAQTEAVVVFKNQSIQNIILDNDAWITDNEVKPLEYHQSIPKTTINYILIGNEKYVPRYASIYTDLKHKMTEKPNDFSMQDAFLMLQVRIQGSVSLFTYKNIDGTTRYLVEKNGRTKEIIKVEFTKGTANLAYLEFYKTDLLELLKDCPVNILKEVEKTTFKLSSLIKLINLYNIKCGQIDYVNAKENFKVSTSLGVYGSLQYFNSKFSNDFYIQDYQTTTKQVGLAIKLKPRLSRENVEVIFFGGQETAALGFQLPNTTSVTGVDTIITAGQYSTTAREFGIGFNYYFDKKLGQRQNISPFVGCSFAHRQLIIHQNILEETRITPNPFQATTVSYSPIVFERFTNISRFKLHAGLSVANFETSVQIGTSKGGLTNTDEEMNVTVGLNIGYFFNIQK